MRRILVAALAAGAIAGLFFFGVQSAKLTPLILAAEVYEEAAGHQHGEAAAAEWEPSAGLERILLTALADVIVAIGYALLLIGVFALRGVPVGVARGVAWGAAGYAAFSLAPALGLPPELPGMHSADLLARQEWWLGTAASTAAGIALLAFSRSLLPKAAGIVLIALPQLVGAPNPPAIGGTVPPELAAAFTAASLAVTAAFWLVLGAAAGGIYERLGASDDAARRA